MPNPEPLTAEELEKLDCEMKPTWCDSGMTVADFCGNEEYWRLRATVDHWKRRAEKYRMAIEAAASAPGRDWLAEQLKLAEILEP